MKRKKLKSPVAIAEVLEKVLKKQGIAKKIYQYGVFDAWVEIVGETIGKRSRPVKMQGDTLVVAAKNSVWANELSMMKPEILKKIREYYPDAVINDIRFTV
jgi:predicted nucleic acid-binding Zn ribbon protein